MIDGRISYSLSSSFDVKNTIAPQAKPADKSCDLWIAEDRNEYDLKKNSDENFCIARENLDLKTLNTFTNEEDEELLNLLSMYGTNLQAIAKELKTKS